MFIRVKTIKGKPYAYLVQSKWDKRSKKKKQKVKKYLGPIKTLEYTPQDHPITSLREAVQRELQALGFKQTSKHILKHENLVVNLKKKQINSTKPIVIKCNDGLLCKHTLKELFNYKHQEEAKPGHTLARALTHAGVHLSQEEFIQIYTMFKCDPETTQTMEQQLKDTLKEQLKAEISLEIPPNQAFGNFAIHAYKLKTSPKDLRAKLKLPDFIEKTEIKGPYLNFFIKKSHLAKEAITTSPQPSKQQKTIIFEFPSPNTNKPLHLGHIRNMVTGQSLAQIKKATTKKVILADLRNNRGIAVCKSMLAYREWGNNQPPTKKPDHYVGDFYVKYAQEAKKNPDLEIEAKILLQQWENGEPEAIELWKKMDGWVQQGIEETYRKFNLEFDKVYRESDIYAKGADIIKKATKEGLFEVEESGAIQANLEPELPNKILLRSDGTAIYITQDIALAIEKYKDFNIDESVILTATEQNLHFKQHAKIMKMLGYTFTNTHVGHGMVHLPEGRMKSREGTVVDADDFLDELVTLAKHEIKERHGDVDDIDTRAKAIALGAIRFYMLKVDTHKDITYDPKESLAFEGETGPYIQYTHARACSILRKQAPTNVVDFNLLTDDHEQKVCQLLLQKCNAITHAAQYNKPSTITRYCIDLAQAFNEYYHACHILGQEKALTNARLALVKKTQETLQEMLDLLAIQAPESM